MVFDNDPRSSPYWTPKVMRPGRGCPKKPAMAGPKITPKVRLVSEVFYFSYKTRPCFTRSLDTHMTFHNVSFIIPSVYRPMIRPSAIRSMIGGPNLSHSPRHPVRLTPNSSHGQSTRKSFHESTPARCIPYVSLQERRVGLFCAAG